MAIYKGMAEHCIMQYTWQFIVGHCWYNYYGRFLNNRTPKKVHALHIQVLQADFEQPSQLPSQVWCGILGQQDDVIMHIK